MQAWHRPGHRNGRPRLGFVLTLTLPTFLASSSSRICCLAALCLAARARSAHARCLALSWARAARCFALCLSKTAMARRHWSKEGAALGAMLVGTLGTHERLRRHTCLSASTSTIHLSTCSLPLFRFVYTSVCPCLSVSVCPSICTELVAGQSAHHINLLKSLKLLN